MRTGEAISSELPAVDETYYLVETKSNDIYELSNEILEIELTANDITEIIFEDNARTSSIQINKIDTDNNEYKIANAVFEITDETTGEIIGTVTTNEEGIATIDDLKVTHTYSIKEIQSNYKYQLSDEVITNITLTADEITSITFENEKIKGQVKVIKVDKDDNTVLIPDVEFEILNCNMEVIETLVTDENRRSYKF